MAATCTAAGQPKYGLQNDFDGLRSALPALVAAGQQVYPILHAFRVCVEFAQKVLPTATAFDGIIITSPTPPTSISAEFSSAMKHLAFDVFINHHGGDVKHTLADRIYNSLHGNGLKVFLDKNELELGDYFPIALEEAMHNASIHIAIFSENYAHSPWCLAELTFMLGTRIRFIPIFYHVLPSSLRWACCSLVLLSSMTRK
ncbi:hypothetical protein SUGI_0970280 [Cryptomeria japonica]|nr:hypothetical protein SUGI_0970280 [Cryptomeria japonica]